MKRKGKSMFGKEKCKMLKEIRAEIAKNNEIEFVTKECTQNDLSFV